MKKGMVLSIAFVAFLIIMPPALAATIHGKVFDYSLKLATSSIVAINTVPEQRVVAFDGTYSFIVDNGDYVLSASVKDENDQLVYLIEDNISVVDDGDYVRDLILFPYEDLDELDIDDNMDSGIGDEPIDRSLRGMLFRLMLVLGIGVVVFALVMLFIVGKKKKLDSELKAIEPRGDSLAREEDELAQILAFIRKHKRVTQKEIRKAFPLSEAKISLIITDLESQGKVRKIKKGRGNVIIADDG
ncbi:hypothetical protein JXB28_06415 [Candidatus Woesearchaeota archaeon]|nr:hypothetical protein [Candidatus Woesearchaeota archaeon]